MWNLNLPGFPHAILGPMDTTPNMAMGKEGLNLEANQGEYLRLKKDPVNHKSLDPTPIPNIPSHWDRVHP